MSSLFTKIINKEIPAEIIYEDKHTIAFLDIMPFEKGHTLVVPKKEVETIFEMSEEEFLNLQKVIFNLAKHMEKQMNCGLNILQNNKEISGQEIPHVHFHLIPRKEKKEIFCSKLRTSYLKDEAQIYKNKLRY